MFPIAIFPQSIFPQSIFPPAPPVPTSTTGAPSNQLFTVARGIAALFVINLDPGIGPYNGTEALAGVIWPGEDQAPSLTFTPKWFSGPGGIITLPFTTSNTASLAPGQYRGRVTLADLTADLWDGVLEVVDSPGTAGALVSYGEFSDMLDRAPWIEKLQRPTDLAGFARQRYQARRWFEDLLHRHYRGVSGVSTDFAFVPGISFGGLYGGGVLWRDGRRSTDLQGWLDDDRLDVTDQVVDAVSLYAIALICERQVVPAKDDTGYGLAAIKYFARAEAAAAEITAEIDTNGDGQNDTVIRLGSTDTLDG